jgi:hypothetical protein
MFGRSKASIDFLADWQISAALMRIISEAKQRLTLVSPYNRHWGHLRREVAAAQQRGIDVTVFYRSDEASPVADNDSITAIPIRMLHAKIYANETAALITSMNLVETSAMYSRDVGLLVQDAKLRREIDGFIRSLWDSVDTEAPGGTAASGNGSTARLHRVSTATDIARVIDIGGFCIECGNALTFDPEKPLCPQCYSRHGRHGVHRICHKCGESHRALLNEPLCRVCAAEQPTSV